MNKVIPGRTSKQYYADNIENKKMYVANNRKHISDNHCKYMHEHPEKMLSMKEYAIDYRTKNIEALKQRRKLYIEKNKEYMNHKCKCSCGRNYLQKAKARHEKSIYHVKFVINITNNITGNDATVNINQQKTELELLGEELNQL